MKLKNRLFAAAALALSLGLASTAVAYAGTATDPIQTEVDSLLAEYEGGAQTGYGEISWDEGRAILTLEMAAHSRVAVGSCPSGSFCAYSSSSLGGTRIAFTSCTATNSLAPIGNGPRSIANGRSSGTVNAYNGSSTIASIGAGSYSNVAITATRLGC